ncbi:hypothetical protein EVAR_31541_1 [Eumeta japonica]|uniref:Uncharacterized protein n=1 Tax=Eumeta variegata TaxID=151549 RepID=A0A4C1V8M7_EUMVA|nr:hypothetical protein EVAR_31541_1 [Eumeta japonica]
MQGDYIQQICRIQALKFCDEFRDGRPSTVVSNKYVDIMRGIIETEQKIETGDETEDLLLRPQSKAATVWVYRDEPKPMKETF